MRRDRLRLTRTVTWIRNVRGQWVYAVTVAFAWEGTSALCAAGRKQRGMKGGGAWGGLHVTWSAT